MILGRIGYFIIVFMKLTAFYLWIFYKRKGLPCPDTVIQTFGVLLDFQKAKNTHLEACVFLHLSQVSQHPMCLDHSNQTWESILYFVI